MTTPVISVRGIGKHYQIRRTESGRFGTDLADDLRNALRSFSKFRIPRATYDTFHALEDVSFDAFAGEAVGLLGRNGAGKSTLLKTLARVIRPSKGEASLFGRVGSLLEVGTGFHPDLTGQENVYLAGAILGLSRREVRQRFEQIVEFAEVGAFLDTPVKRYSSGMYTRLAYAVAAHLEADILLVDEVLAVGDAAFQKKCLGQMNEATRQGRTVVFVSHNLAQVRAFCTRGIVLEKGRVVFDGSIGDALNHYSGSGEERPAQVEWTNPLRDGFRFLRCWARQDGEHVGAIFDPRDPLKIGVEFEVSEGCAGLRVGLLLSTLDGLAVTGGNHPISTESECPAPGIHRLEVEIPAHLLNWGDYVVHFGADVFPWSRSLAVTPSDLGFRLEDVSGRDSGVRPPLPGILRPELRWTLA
jgi:lipopolysaccharide transport system ATP-binding protein